MLYFLSTTKRLLAASFLSLLAALMLYSVIDLIEHVRLVLANDASPVYLADLAFAHFPTAAYQLIPIALIFGSLSVMMEMVRNGELTILRSSGQNPKRRYLPFLCFSIAAALLLFAMGEGAAPPGERRYRELIDGMRDPGRKAAVLDRSRRIWFSGPSGLWRVESGGGESLRDVDLYMTDGDGKVTMHLRMDSLDRRRGVWLAKGVVTKNANGRVIERRHEKVLHITEGPEHFEALWTPPETMKLPELLWAIRLRQSQGLNPAGYETALWLRFAVPLLCFTLPFLGAIFAWRRGRDAPYGGKRLAALGLGAGLGIFLFLMMAAGKSMAETGYITPFLGVMFTPILAGGFAFVGVKSMTI